MNNDNLRPFNKRTESEQREIAQKGGKASGESRRRNKGLRKTAELLLDMGVKDINVKHMMKDYGVKKEDMTFAMWLNIAMLEKAAGGNVRAYEALLRATENSSENQLEIITEDALSVALENVAKELNNEFK